MIVATHSAPEGERMNEIVYDEVGALLEEVEMLFERIAALMAGVDTPGEVA